ncbi:MAG: UTP--glucose-1-phosphate uridylyltransferase [Candidatus Saganbacteria bacterium]|nr:UTP--glucose-1-phosphate uridylyltransferase [Candidatus Saganbacteria bacterium]
MAVGFGSLIQQREMNRQFIINAAQVRRSRAAIPQILRRAIRDKELEQWFHQEAGHRLQGLDPALSGAERQNALEMANRYPAGSMQPISLEKLLQMPDLCLSPNDIIDRAKQGVELLRSNTRSDILGTAARGIPGGGASSRAAKWARLNPELAARFDFDENTPRPLYRIGDRTLFQLTLEMSQHIAREIGRVFPNLAMTNSENVKLFMADVKQRWGNWRQAELENTVFFNQVVMPRMWVQDQQIIESKLYPAGHGDYPMLFARYSMAKTLLESGVKYFLFSNADEFLWQADPVIISIAQEMFDRGHHMVIIGVENINNQFGGGFVRTADGKQSLVETPRLPWEVVQAGRAPIALNTTFYICDVEYLAAHEADLLAIDKSLVVKEVPGRAEGSVEQIFGVDSWAGDIFAAVLNPAFIQFPRMNFLGIKDGGFITGGAPVEALGGRTYLHYVNETVATFPPTMSRLIAGDRAMAEELHANNYSYLPLQLA